MTPGGSWDSRSREFKGAADPGGSGTVTECGIHEDVTPLERNGRFPKEMGPQALQPASEVGLTQWRNHLGPGWWCHMIKRRGLFDEGSHVVGSEGIQRSNVRIRYGIGELGGDECSEEVVELGKSEASVGGVVSIGRVSGLGRTSSVGRAAPVGRTRWGGLVAEGL